MKRLIVTFLTPIIFSCGTGLTEQADSGNVLKSFTFTVDTLVVNSGESFFNVKSSQNLSQPITFQSLQRPTRSISSTATGCCFRKWI
jgi:hypothetical protein